MSAFRFRLETVRKLREDNEMESAGELASAMAEAGSADAEAERLANMEEAGRSEMSRLSGDLGRQKSVAVILEHLAEHRAVAERACHVAKDKVEARVEAFREAVTKRRAIDRLKEKQFEEWDTDARRREQKATDEINSNRHGAAETVPGGVSKD